MRRNTPVHLVGSLPSPLCRDPATAMRWFLRHCGDAEVTALPFERDPRWIIDWLDRLAAVPALEPVRTGASRHYGEMPFYRLRPDHRLSPAAVAWGLPSRTADALSALDALRPNSPPRLQVGVPNALDMALFAFGSTDAAWEQLPVMQEAVNGEVAYIAARWGERIQFQLDTPAVLVSYCRTPREAWPDLTRRLVCQATKVLDAAPHGRWVVHLCYGDLGHQPVFMPTDLEPAVTFVNALADYETSRQLPVPTVHLPVTTGDAAPPTDPEFYRALRGLRRGVKVIAGVVAESHPKASREALDLVEDALGCPVSGVAAPCGYGRRTPEAAAANLELAVLLASAAGHPQH